MSLNSPVLVAVAGTGAFISLPTLEKLVASGAIPWNTLKAANIIAYAIQVIAVSVPGRIDGEVAKAIQEEKGDASEGAASAEGKNLAPRNGRTLVAPAGWAFAIWGPIFLGELVFVASQASISASDPLAPIVKKMSLPFAMAHTFQSLWCCAFRRKYSGNLMYISFGMLSATAYSLSKAHAAYTSELPANTSPYGFMTYLTMFLPISMHCGWTVAASLVNLNGAFSMKETASSKAIAFLGHGSVIAATALGVFVSLSRSAPVFGGVISWALFAVADGMKQRLKASEKEDDETPGIYGARTQRKLSVLGAVVTGAAAVITAGRMFYLGRNGSKYRSAP